jgi:hypothetical protein
LQVEDVENPLLEAQEKLADSTILFCQVRGFQAPFSSSKKAIPGTIVQFLHAVTFRVSDRL